MDKELLRVVIIATGLVVIMGMLLWSYWKNRSALQDDDLFDETEFKGKSKLTEPAVKQPSSHWDTSDDDFDIVPVKAEKPEANDKADQFFEDFGDDFEEDNDLPPRFETPAIIQFSVVAKADEGFNGLDLFNAFQIVGLEYGSLKIFERLDANRLVDFGVACMVEPGTFPSTDLEEFYCPGIVFFMQPGELEDAAAVFDDFIDTIRLLAVELDGEILDHQRKPLSDVAVDLIRQSL